MDKLGGPWRDLRTDCEVNRVEISMPNFDADDLEVVYGEKWACPAVNTAS